MTSNCLLKASLMLSVIGTSLYASHPWYDEPPSFDFHAFTGYRMDQLEFSIAEQHKNDCRRDFKGESLESYEDSDEFIRHPECHSRGSEAKVKWKSLKIAQVGAILNCSTYNHYCFKASANYGHICDGRANIDTHFHFKKLAPPEPRCRRSSRGRRWNRHLRDLGLDFGEYESSLCGYTVNKGSNSERPSKKRSKKSAENSSLDSLVAHRAHRRRHRSRRHAKPCYNHHVEVSRQSADADDGNVADLSAAIGYKFISDTGRTSITGLGGWSGHAQQVRLSNAVQEKDSASIVPLGDVSALSAKYDTRWQGPWVGFDLLCLVDYNVTIYGSAEWHWASYEASGNWNFGKQYNASIKHRARGYGVVGTLGFDWNFCTNWNAGIIGNFQQWSTRQGHNHSRICNTGLASDEIETVFPVMKKSALSLAKWISFSVSGQIVYRF